MSDLLKLDLGETDVGSATLGIYLVAFIGVGMQEKRPFGNSDWFSREIVTPMIRAGLVSGKLDEDDYLLDWDREAVARLLADAISEIRGLVRERACGTRS